MIDWLEENRPWIVAAMVVIVVVSLGAAGAKWLDTHYPPGTSVVQDPMPVPSTFGPSPQQPQGPASRPPAPSGGPGSAHRVQVAPKRMALRTHPVTHGSSPVRSAATTAAPGPSSVPPIPAPSATSGPSPDPGPSGPSPVPTGSEPSPSLPVSSSPPIPSAGSPS